MVLKLLDMKLRIIILAAMGCLSLLARGESPQVIAHRGYWQVEGSAQNSIRSLVTADSIGCYGSEFDVWMTADSVLVVNHDAEFRGVDIQNSPSDKVLALRLDNGESLPTLDALFEAAKSLNTRLICELKVHDSRSREKTAVSAILAKAHDYGLEDRMEYITFSSQAFSEFIRLAPKGTPVYYLNGDFMPAQIEYMHGAGIDYYIDILRKHPEWIADCHKRGLKLNAWTVDKPEDMKWCIDNNIDFITTNRPEILQNLIKAYQNE